MTNYILIDDSPKYIYIYIHTDWHCVSTYINFLGSGKMFLPENNREMTCLTVLGCNLKMILKTLSAVWPTWKIFNIACNVWEREKLIIETLEFFPPLFYSIEKGSCIMGKIFHIPQHHKTFKPFLGYGKASINLDLWLHH